MSEKQFDYKKSYFKRLKQTKGHEFYLELMLDHYNKMEIAFQTFIVIATIIGIIVLFSRTLEGVWAVIVMITTIIAQISTLLYPYLFQFNKKIMKISEIKSEITNLFDEKIIEYITLEDETEEKLIEKYKNFFNKHSKIRAKFNEPHFIKSIDEKYQEIAVDETIKYLEAYFCMKTEK